MNILTSALVTITAGVLFAGCQSDEPQATESKQSMEVSTKLFTLATPQVGDLIIGEVQSPVLDAINSSRDSISFVNVNPSEQALLLPSSTSSSQSDEFWMTVSGAELNKGVKLAISQPSSIIRVAPRADNRSGSIIKSQSISPEQIQLQKVGAKTDKSVSYIKSLTDADALATAGLDDNSSALTLSKNATAGIYKLRVVQSLDQGGQYLVNVKEKGSPYQLTLSSINRVASDVSSMPLSLSLSNSQSELQPQASLKHADGKIQTLDLKLVNGQWQAKLPTASKMPESNLGLSEIQVNIQTQVNGQAVFRTVKTAFKQFVPTAKLNSSVESQWQDQVPKLLIFDVAVEHEGRFGINAALTGTDELGNDKLILTTQSANWLTSKSSQITLNLDASVIKASGLKAPFKIKSLELVDQGQMARLSYLQQALIMRL
ncbi:DUF4785 domain-containing protein [Shewanella sp. Choline-02u-19]|uniref:DUF4785 domain-containing protein n=1 Tax=unclassified Shewanella TaxID=196818 RepID=UPI000C31F6D3|nr:MULTISPECIES: DUF4785 domain-containing protein [unclassified Shewanella]PKG58381.1 DUF4785 domain-containing protein [Shewanella sp. GutDb-MelDb]PKG73347.1 DUF4785 domain-containing protein [Shewanella sp. GutCb]PKH59185.1 DUF4785 domain-containing protein [Shewanella sp. Bg11-22]PKI27060.1 DUF4785 domain-containing protein [Shewanella sp. Choline-02u-19]